MSTATATRPRRARAEQAGALEEAEHRREEAAESIVNQYGACRVMFSWMSARKSLDKAQRHRVAVGFEADTEWVGASKKLFDTKHPKYRAVTNCRTRIEELWESMTLPYIEPGVRLIRLEHVEAFDGAMRGLATELAGLVRDLADEYEALKAESRRRLGTLYNPADYAEDIRAEFGVAWDFPALAPPDYLAFLNPEIAEREAAKYKARLEETVALAEAAFLEEFRSAVLHLTERLSGSEDGKPKVFRDSVVDNLRDFFDRFKVLNLRSNPELDALVERAKSVVGDRDAEELRGVAELRAEVAAGLSAVAADLGDIAVARPRRRVARLGQGEDGI